MIKTTRRCAWGRFWLAMAAASVAAGPALASDDDWERLKDALMYAGTKGMVKADAAASFGLASRDYPERFMEVVNPDTTRRSMELVGNDEDMNIFFTEQTRAEIITIRLSTEGDFITGLERMNDSDDVTKLSGNQGRVFLEAQKDYWLNRLSKKREASAGGATAAQ